MDKDGTLIPDIPYNVNPDLVTISEAMLTFIEDVRSEGFLFIIVSNQSGIAKGIFTDEALAAVWRKISAILQEHGQSVDGIYYCPHDASPYITADNVLCNCRKPRPGMLLQAAKDFDIDLSASWMIGDILHDVEAGNRAGCRTILLDNGNETEWRVNEYRKPGHVVRRIQEATMFILQQENYEAKQEYIPGDLRSVQK